MIYAAQDTNKICYMILPEGIREDLFDGLKELTEKYGVSFVVIENIRLIGHFAGCDMC